MDEQGRRRQPRLLLLQSQLERSQSQLRDSQDQNSTLLHLSPSPCAFYRVQDLPRT